jgi:hypothetical protein
VFLRRINTRQSVENSNHGNPVQHDGATVTFAGSGLQAFTKIRITNRSGRIHMTGIAFTRQIDDGYEGTGMVHPAQISHQGAGSGLNADLLDGYSSATANTANTIVLRDASGNFSAGTITATLSGNASTVTNGFYTTGGQTIAGITYFSNGESMNVYGIRGRFTNEYLHLYNKVGVGHPGGWGQGEGSTPNQGLSTYGGITVAYGTNATSIFYGNVGIGTTVVNARVESYYSSNAITFNYLATNLNNNSPIPVYGFDVTNGAGESRSIKAGIGYERHETNGRGTIHFYNDSTNDTQSLSGNRSSAGDIKMSINNVGNVGIGTPNPATLLHVDTAGADARIRVSAGTNTVQGGMIANTNGFVYAGSITNHGFILRTNDTDRVRIDTSGNVGIGTTNPQYKLDVNGESNFNGVIRVGTVAVLNESSNANDIYANIRVLRNRSSTSTDGMYINYDSTGTTSAHLRFYANAGNERMRIQANDGHVGIGTSSAGRRLDVEGIVRTRGASGSGGFEIGAATTGAAKWRIEWDSASDSLDFNWVG